MLRKGNFDFDNEEAKGSNAFLVSGMRVERHHRKGRPRLVTRTFPVWYDDPLVQYLREWLPNVEDYLFPSQGGRDPFLTRQNAIRNVKELGKRSRVYITPKWFREQRIRYLAERKIKF